MRALPCSLVLLAALLPGLRADELPIRFQGQGMTSSETTVFTVNDRWEVEWNCPATVTVEKDDGSPVAGTKNRFGGGSLFMERGGTFKVRITPESLTPMSGGVWQVTIEKVARTGDQMTVTSPQTYVPPDVTSLQPASSAAENGVGQSIASMTGGNPTPAPAGPPANVVPGSPMPGTVSPAAPISSAGAVPITATSTPVVSLDGTAATAALARGVVLIKGDNAEGTGFLVKLPSGPVVVTNQHVLANNPHVQITTSSGETVKQLGLHGASDRDLAMIPIQDNNYTYLDMATDVGSTVQPNDVVITPGNSQGGEVLLNTRGTVTALGPQRVEISNPIYHGNSGGPVFHVKSGKIIGVVTEAMAVDTTDSLDKASFSSHDSAIKGPMRYFGLRVDSVPKWENYTWQRFENETTFLSDFHECSKCLDSYLNTGTNDTTPWGLYYLKNDQIKLANDALGSDLQGGDSSQRMEAWRTLVFSLDNVADKNLTDAQNPGNFYSYDQTLARDEVAYRTALHKEIDNMSSDISRLGSLARRNN